MTGWAVSVPASSANLGAGFDVFGMALTLHAEIGCGTPPDGATSADDHHPAMVAFRRLGGRGPLWVRSPIPMGRGLGYSGAVRVGGAMAAVVQDGGPTSFRDLAARSRVLELTAGMEGHADNVGASLMGGVVVASGSIVTAVPLRLDPAILVWVPTADATSTDRSRSQLPATVDRADAVFNIGRAALFVAACASGDTGAMRAATQDRLHQSDRLERAPASAVALQAGLDAGAWAAWLSGSGPTVAMMCDHDLVDAIAASLPPAGHTKLLEIDHDGTALVEAS